MRTEYILFIQTGTQENIVYMHTYTIEMNIEAEAAKTRAIKTKTKTNNRGLCQKPPPPPEMKSQIERGFYFECLGFKIIITQY